MARAHGRTQPEANAGKPHPQKQSYRCYTCEEPRPPSQFYCDTPSSDSSLARRASRSATRCASDGPRSPGSDDAARCRNLHIGDDIAEQVRPAILALARGSPDVRDERIDTRGEPLQHSLDVIDRLEPRALRCRVTLGSCPQLPSRLRTSQHHHRQQCQLIAVESDGVVENVSVFVGAAAAVHSCQALLTQEQHRVHHDLLAVVGYRLAVRLLVARSDERVRRERILLGRCRLLLDQAAQGTKFFSSELHRTTVMPASGCRWSETGDRSAASVSSGSTAT